MANTLTAKKRGDVFEYTCVECQNLNHHTAPAAGVGDVWECEFCGTEFEVARLLPPERDTAGKPQEVELQIIEEEK